MKRLSKIGLWMLTLLLSIAFCCAIAQAQTAEELTIDRVFDAAARLKGTAYVTPLLFSDAFSGQA